MLFSMASRTGASNVASRTGASNVASRTGASNVASRRGAPNENTASQDTPQRHHKDQVKWHRLH